MALFIINVTRIQLALDSVSSLTLSMDNPDISATSSIESPRAISFSATSILFFSTPCSMPFFVASSTIHAGTTILYAPDNTDTVNMYRLYNPNSGEHFYTANAGERNHLISIGWYGTGTGG